MSDFEQAIGPVLVNEGEGYVEEDHGRGASKWGITLATYREHYPEATALNIRDLTRGDAVSFYRKAFWQRYNIGEINDQALAGKILDLSVNMGPQRPIRFLQKAAGVDPDGILGQDTAGAVNKQDPRALLTLIHKQAAAFYIDLAAANPDDAHELGGWLARLDK